MKQIWKYELNITDSQQIPMPQGAQLLSVGVQNQTPVMWAKVDLDAKQELVTVWIIGTGQPYSGAGKFIGTFQIGGFVGHVFVIA